MEKIIITRHKALVDYLKELGLADDKTPVMDHAMPEHVRGKHVLGVLPLHLAALAVKVTEVPLNVPYGERGKELSLEQVRDYATRPKTYEVRRID